MKTLVGLFVLVAFAAPACADSVVATTVRQGNTIVTTTPRGTYTTEIRRSGNEVRSETRFQGSASRNEYRPMTH